tara:strand:+ start:304 stop:900 length:597 start_codon:yes stop_codon:yes gene_type:complete
MKLIKMDYARVYELILAELTEAGHDNIVNWLTENPPKTYNGRLFSVDLAESLVEAKTKTAYEVKLSDLDSIRNYSNLRIMLDKHDAGKWFDKLKAEKPDIIINPPKTKITQPGAGGGTDFITGINLGMGDDPDDDDECECDVEDCDKRAVWKCQSHCERKLCGKHLAKEGRDEHDYEPWDCETDEFYDYIEDVPGPSK